MNHRYSTYTLLAIFLVIGILLVSGLESEEIDETICNQDNMTLVRIDGLWQCGNVSEMGGGGGATIDTSNFTYKNNSETISGTWQFGTIGFSNINTEFTLGNTGFSGRRGFTWISGLFSPTQNISWNGVTQTQEHYSISWSFASSSTPANKLVVVNPSGLTLAGSLLTFRNDSYPTGSKKEIVILDDGTTGNLGVYVSSPTTANRIIDFNYANKNINVSTNITFSNGGKVGAYNSTCTAIWSPAGTPYTFCD